MKFNFKEYEIQDITCKGPMRRRYNDLYYLNNNFESEFIKWNI